MSTIKVNAIESTASGGVAAKIASINDGALSNRNLLHNSSFEIWQRGTSFSSGASGGNRYTSDRWSVPNRTRAAISTDVPAGFKYAILLDREQTGGTEPFTIHQGIEKDNIRLTGSYTLSFYAKSSDISTVNINVQDRTTVAEGGTNHSSIVTNQAVSITSSWARYTHTFTLSSASLTGTCLRISIGNTSAAQHDELLLTGIQLETGSVATNIDKRSYGEELAICNRYYQKYKHNTYRGIAFTGRKTGSGTVVGCIHGFPPMRVAATGSVDNVGGFRLFRFTDASTATPTNIAFTHETVSGSPVNVLRITASTSSFSTGQFCGMYATPTNGTFDLDAEL